MTPQKEKARRGQAGRAMHDWGKRCATAFSHILPEIASAITGAAIGLILSALIDAVFFAGVWK